MPRPKRDDPAATPEELARRRGMSMLRGPQLRVAQRPAAPAEDHALPGAREVPLDRVLPDPTQPRRDWSHDDGERRLEELAASIREFGILQPLLVREGRIREDGAQEFIVIAGGRRRAAAERAGLATVPVLIRGEEGTRVRVLQLLENLQRAELSPLDEARAFQELLDIEGYSPPELAARLKISDQKVRERLQLLANQVIADALERKQLNLTTARDLQRLPDDEIERFRGRLARGEHIPHTDVEVHRQRLRAAGVVNPRFKGGGRSGSAGDGAATDQAALDSAPSSQPDVTRSDGVATGDQAALDSGANGEIIVRSSADGPAGQSPVSGHMKVAPPRAGQPAVPAPAAPTGHPAATWATAREPGTRMWRFLPADLQASIRELTRVDPSLGWGVALAEGLGRHFSLDQEEWPAAPDEPEPWVGD